MLDTRLSNDRTLRCEALLDRVAATAIGPNAHALRVTLAECDAIERTVARCLSVRIGWPLPWRRRNDLMMRGPNRKTNRKAVNTAPPVRNVM